jgi:hypothetical protein
MQTLSEQSQKQREAFQVLASGTWDAYMGFLSSPFSYYEKAMETAESIAMQGVDTVQKMTRHEKQTVSAT